MSPFLESIRLEKQHLQFMQGHETRFVTTQQDNWGKVLYHDLKSLILHHTGFPKDDQKYKCRVVYSPEEISISFIAYTPRVITGLRVVTDDDINYRYKSVDRSRLDALTSGLPPNTEILIFQNELLTDSSFSNLALFDGKNWWTPKTPLLQGIHRSYLLDKRIIREKDISRADLKEFKQIRLINVMMDWNNTWTLPVTAINA